MRVVHCEKEQYDVYIGRPSKWGNDYSHKEGTLAKFKVNSRQESLEKYETDIRQNKELMDSLHELKDKTLGCWCKPLSCHGDILIKLLKEKELEDIFNYDSTRST